MPILTLQPAPEPDPSADGARSVGKKPLPELLPARMLNEFVYCPRLFYYEWVEGVFRASADTEEGEARHARVHTEPGALPAADKLAEAGLKARSVELSSDRLGLIARMDLVESVADGEAAGSGEGAAVRPVDYKRGRPCEYGDLPAAWPADRVQIGVQALVLRDSGYRCEEGVLYYAASKQRVRVPIDGALVEETLAALDQARAAALSERIPPPLVDSPKCPRCSLVGICLPDETNALQDRALTVESPERARQFELFPLAADAPAAVRQLISARDDLRPLYLNSQGMRVGKSAQVVQVREKETLVQEARLGELSQVNLFGNVQISTQALQSFCAAEIPVCYFSQGGYFYGITSGLNSRNVMLRRTQFRAAENPAVALELARMLVNGKIRNQRTLLQRNHTEPPALALRQLKQLAESALLAPSQESLLGLEGSAARLYFENFAGMLKPDDETEAEPAAADLRFDFNSRNRRPPRDPVNALLSLAYSLLAKDLTVTCQAMGFDAYWGFYHQPRFGRPALALDLMEPFRPLIADSAVLSAINTRMVTPADFVRSGPAVALTPNGRKGFFRAYELRMDGLATHPELDYRVSYRRMLEVQARLLARYLDGEIRQYPVFVTR
ncbi:MAG TPA: CRISPR-associated endonuclease Cas1 [Terriglobales bacterium]|nr:CRISPR-associated endonuclease Cas1 [Terriglobales bacterium]